MNKSLLNKLPKKHHKYIKDIYKEGNRYSVVIKFPDGFTRSIGDTNFTEIRWMVKEIIEENRHARF